MHLFSLGWTQTKTASSPWKWAKDAEHKHAWELHIYSKISCTVPEIHNPVNPFIHLSQRLYSFSLSSCLLREKLLLYIYSSDLTGYTLNAKENTKTTYHKKVIHLGNEVTCSSRSACLSLGWEGANFDSAACKVSPDKPDVLRWLSVWSDVVIFFELPLAMK